MFYEVANGHGLPHDPFKALVAPRPIGWISSVSAKGEVNLSPYSYFNGICDRPPMVLFSSSGRKDAIAFAEETGEFVCSIASWDQREQMNLTSAPLPRGRSEFGYAGLEMAPSVLVKPPRVGGAPAALECKLTQIVEPKTVDGTKAAYMLAIGQVVGVHIDDRFLKDGYVQTALMKIIARAGYRDNYFVADHLFLMDRPTTVEER